MTTEATTETQEEVQTTDVTAENSEVTSEGNADATQEAVVATAVEPDEESIKKFFASKGRTVEKLDDLFVEKEKVVEVNPYANASDQLKQIFEYEKETGRGIKDYFKLQENIDDRPLVELALEKVRNEVGGSFSPEDLTAYLEDALAIDLSGDLTPTETVKLTKFVKDYKEQLKADQEKYKTPLPKAPEAKTTTEVEMITLADGQKVEKSVYEAHEQQRQIYLNDIKEAVNSVAASSIKIEFDNNGVKEELTYSYDYDANDHQNMVAIAEDLDQTVSKLFRTEKGFNHQDFIESTWFLDKVNREKWATALVNKARAEAITELTKADNNVNFNTNGMPTKPGDPNVKIVPIKELFNR
ncbi:MAG: hypothetical protein H7Y10_03625 [Flavobacterium sp.]|nr:hypothetical protein [Flavobacterium sp.]